jgi:hypothetical protein
MLFISNALLILAGDSGCSPSFPPESFENGEVVGTFARQKFQCDCPMKPRILTLVDDPHTSPAKLFEQAIVRYCASELLDQPENVQAGVRIQDLSVHDAMDSDPIHRHFLVRGRNPNELTFVGARHVPERNYLLSCGNYIFDFEANIRKTREEPIERSSISFRTNSREAHDGALESIAGGKYFAQEFESPSIPDLFVEAANDGNVLV